VSTRRRGAVLAQAGDLEVAVRSATLLLDGQMIPLPTQDVARLVVGLQELAIDQPALSRTAMVLVTRLKKPGRVGLLTQAVEVQPGESGLLLELLDRLEPRNARVAQLERALRKVVANSDGRKQGDGLRIRCSSA
jgi:hypothetical protein